MSRQETLETLTNADIAGVTLFLVLSGVASLVVARRFPPRAPEGPHEPPLWGGAEVLVAIGVLVLAQILIVGPVVALGDDLAAGYLVAVQILSMTAACAVIAWWIRRAFGQPLATFGLRPTTWRNVGVVAALSIPIRFFVGLAAVLWQLLLVRGFGLEREEQEAVEIIAAELREGRTISVAFLVVGGTLLAPLWEEFLFRGFLFAWLERRFGLWTGALLSGFLFAAVHRSLEVLLPLWILGVLLAWLYARSRSLVVPIAFHVLFNATTMVVILLYGGEL